MYNVLQIITRLTLGGAQETVFYIYKNLNQNKQNNQKDLFKVYLMAGSKNKYQFESKLLELSADPCFTYIKNLANHYNPIKDMLSIYEIYNYIKANKIDIVHTHSAKAGIVGRIAARLAGVSIIVHTIHGWSFNPTMSNATRRIYILIEKIMAKFTTKLITVTKMDIKKGLLNGIGTVDKYTTIRSGIDFSMFDNNNEDDNFLEIEQIKSKFENKHIVGSVGRLSAQKNYVDFIKIAKKFEEREDIHFVIVGDGEARLEIEDLIKQNNLEKKISLLGLRKDISVILRTFDVLLLTSLWEGLPRILIEAMYCKVPIVANAVDGVCELIKDEYNGFLLTPGDVLEATIKIEKLLYDNDTRQKIIANAINALDEYSASKMIEETQKLYFELITMEGLYGYKKF